MWLLSPYTKYFYDFVAFWQIPVSHSNGKWKVKG